MFSWPLELSVQYLSDVVGTTQKRAEMEPRCVAYFPGKRRIGPKSRNQVKVKINLVLSLCLGRENVPI